MIYGYIRVSTDKQTVENQRYEINNFCSTKNIAIDGWIEETISGTRAFDKRLLGDLLKKVQKDDLIICAELSRLGRNLFMIMEILNICMGKECKVWTIKDNYRLGDDIQSKVLAFAFGLSAEIERNLISQRTKEALARKKAEGVILGRPTGSRSESHKCDKYKDEIFSLLDKGISYAGIGRIIGVHRQTVSDYIEHIAITEMDNCKIDKTNRGKLTAENVKELRGRGLSTFDVAKYYNVSVYVLGQTLKKQRLQNQQEA